MKRIILILLVSISILGCEHSPEVLDSKSPNTTEGKTTAKENFIKVNGENIPMPVGGENSTPTIEAYPTFADFIDGADTIELSKRGADGKPAQPVTVSKDLVKDIILAVGSNTKASGVVPKCLGTYQMVFLKAGTKVASIQSICSGETAVLSNGKMSFMAVDSKALITLLERHADPKTKPEKTSRCCAIPKTSK